MNSPELLVSLLSQSLDEVSADIGRSQTLVREGVKGLVSSFHGFRVEVQKQHDELVGVARLLRGEGSEKGFLTQMDEVVGRFVTDLVHVSALSMKLVQRLDVADTHVQQIVKHVVRIEGLAKETRFIALNAYIEAHRAGAAGRTFKVVADEVKVLADDAAGFAVLIQDLVSKTDEALAASQGEVEKLASHDMTSALEAQRELGDALRSLVSIHERVKTSLAQVQVHVAESVRALQFEDLVNQLLEGSKNRLAAVREVCIELLGRVALSEAEARRLFEAFQPRLAATGSVRQTSMSEGSVELF